MNPSRPSYLIWLPAVLLAVSLIIFWWLPFFAAPGNVYDESMLLLAPDLVLHGKIPHRDFGTFYGPANAWLLAAAYKLGGVSLLVERLVGLLYRLSYLGVLALLAQRLLPRLCWPMTLCIAAGAVVTIPLALLASAWLPAITLALGGLLLAGSVEGSNLRKGLSGLLIGLGLLFRPDTAPAIGVALLPLLLAWPWKSRFYWLGGVMAGSLPMVFHLFAASPLAVWNNLVYHPVFLSNPGRKIPLGTTPPIVQLVFWLALALGAYNLIVACRRQRPVGKDPFTLAIALFGLMLTYQILQRIDVWHLAMGMMITAPLAVLLFSTRFAQWPRKMQIAAALAAAVAVGGVYARSSTALHQQASLLLPQPSFPVSCGSRTFLLKDPKVRSEVTAVLDYFNSAASAGQTVFVGPGDLRRTAINDIFLYYLLLPKLIPGSYFVELNPLVANAENSGLATDLTRCDWIILDDAWDSLQEPNRSREPGSAEPVRVLERRFAKVLQSGRFAVYKNNSER